MPTSLRAPAPLRNLALKIGGTRLYRRDYQPLLDEHEPPGEPEGETRTRKAVERSEIVYVIREVLNCKPGKVRQLIEKFRSISAVLKEMGEEPLRLLTDVTGEPFWTIVAEAKVEKLDDFFAIEQRLMANETLRKTMADYHDLINRGRREIYRIEN
jgi:hypothetical protein